MNHTEKLAIVKSVESEDTFRVDLVIPLLRKMRSNFSEVLDNQGPDEAGVDVICVSASPFRKAEYTAVVLKKGDITLKAADQKNNLVNTVETQVRTAILHPLTHPRLTADRAYANRVVVITNGSISRNAEVALARAFRDRSDVSLDFVGCDRLVELIDEYWPEFYEDRRPFASTYAKRLYDSLSIVNLELFGYSHGSKTLSDIYIDTLLIPRESIEEYDDIFVKNEYVSGQKVCASQATLVAVTSGPGGGKTTLLKELAIQQSRSMEGTICAYLHAREILHAESVASAAVSALSKYSSDDPEAVARELGSAKLTLLVDGIDELAAIGDRVSVLRSLRQSIGKTAAKVVVGTRPESHPDLLAELADFEVYSIAPLRYGQIRSFFGRWFNDDQRASKLLSALRDKGVLEKLPRTPMTMTLVAIVFESKEDLPANLTQLYEMFVDLLTGKWDSNRQISSPFDSPIKVGFLGFLAWTLQIERLEVVSEERCIWLADEFFSKYATLDNVDSRPFIQSIIDRSHILIPTGAREIRFSHMSFQEFFCAQWIGNRGVEQSVFLGWYGDEWWSEVLFFLAGMREDISALIPFLLEADHSDSETRLTKLASLGAMLQAAFLTPVEDKRRAIAFAASKFMECYSDLEAAILRNVSEKMRGRYSRFILVGILQSVFSSNYTSKYLKTSLLDVYRQFESDYSDGGIAARFLTACSLERLGDDSALLDFASDPKMVDTSMYLIANSLLRNGVLPHHKKALKRVLKRRADFRGAVKRETRRI